MFSGPRPTPSRTMVHSRGGTARISTNGFGTATLAPSTSTMASSRVNDTTRYHPPRRRGDPTVACKRAHCISLTLSSPVTNEVLAGEDALQVLEYLLELPPAFAFFYEAAPKPGKQGMRNPNDPNGDGRGSADSIETKERLPTLSPAPLHPAKRRRPDKIDDLELGLACAEAHREPSALLQWTTALDAGAPWQPGRHPHRLRERGEDRVRRSPDRVN